MHQFPLGADGFRFHGVPVQGAKRGWGKEHDFFHVDKGPDARPEIGVSIDGMFHLMKGHHVVREFAAVIFREINAVGEGIVVAAGDGPDDLSQGFLVPALSFQDSASGKFYEDAIGFAERPDPGLQDLFINVGELFLVACWGFLPVAMKGFIEFLRELPFVNRSELFLGSIHEGGFKNAFWIALFSLGFGGSPLPRGTTMERL